MSGQMRILVDIAEPRPKKGRLAVGSDGNSWDMARSSNMWMDPCTSTIMLRPLPLSAAWKTTFTGNYARFGIADFTGTDILKWEQYAVTKSANDKALSMKSTTALPITYTGTLPANCPIFIKYKKNQTQESSDDAFLTIGYNVGAAGSAPNNFSVQIKFRDNGAISIYKNGLLEGEYDRGSNNSSNRTGYTASNNPSQKYVNVLIIPFRTRDLLVWTDNGTAFCHTFDNLDYPNDVAVNPITPACGANTFSITAPTGKVSLQVARMFFEQSGYALSQVKKLRYAPEVTDWTTINYSTYSQNFGDGASFPTLTPSIVDNTASFLPFVADGSRDTARIKVDFSGSSGGTNAGLYASDGYVDPPYSATDAVNIDITTACETLQLSCDEAGRAGLTFDARNNRLTALGVERVLYTSDRPVKVQIKSDFTADPWRDIFRGTLSSPQIHYEPGSDYVPLDFALLTFTGEDRFYDFSLGQCQEAVPLDFKTIPQVFTNLMPMAGYDPAIYFDAQYTTGYTTDWHPNMARGEYAMIPKRGDSAGSLLTEYRDKFFSTWYMMWRNTTQSTPAGGYKLVMGEPVNMTRDATMELYMSVSDAILGGETVESAPKKVLRSLTRFYEKSEANQVTVIGADPSKNKLISKTIIDTASQEPTTVPASRPDNWRGRPVPYVLTDPSLITQAAVDQAASIISDRISTGRHIIQFESDLLMYEFPEPNVATFYAPTTATITAGVASIVAAQDYFLLQEIKFTTTVGNITAGTTYYIKVISSTAFTIGTTANMFDPVLTPTVSGSSVVSSDQIKCTNAYTLNQQVTLKQTVGNFLSGGAVYYVIAPTATSIRLAITSGGTPVVPTASGSTGVNTGLSKLTVLWLGDEVLINNQSINNTGSYLGSFRIIAIPSITFVKESTDDYSFVLRNAEYKMVGF